MTANENSVALIEGATGRVLTRDDIAATEERWRGEPGLQGRRVGLVVADPLSMAASYLAALSAGITVAPLNPDATPHEMEAQALLLGLSAVVTDRDVDQVTDAFGPGLDVWTTALDRVVDSRRAAPPGGDGAALIMSSSGTTGPPKVIPLTRRQLLHTARGVVEHLGLGAGERGYSPLPLWHINGLVVGVLAAATSGASLVVDRRFSRRSFWQVVADRGVTWVNLVPAIITVLAAEAHGAGAARGVRLARSASAPLAEATRRRFEHRYGIPVVETYGMTEAGSQITANPLDRRRPRSVGLPVGVDLRVVDRTGRPVASGEAGGVQIRGESVTTRYWNPSGGDTAAGCDASRVAHHAMTSDGWLPTGDVGWVDDDGYLFLVGREDDVINRGGEKVQPREVEEVLLADPRVMAAAVVGRPHPTVGQEPVAYVIAGSTGPHDTLVADLRRRVESALSRFKQPAAINVVDTLPAGPTGKVRRADVIRLAAASSDLAAGA